MASSPKAIIVTELDSNKIVACNQKWNRLCGYPPEEALGKKPSILQGEGTSKSKASDFAAQIYATGTATVKLVNYTKLGRAFVHCLRTRRVTDVDTGTAYYVTESHEETDMAIQRAMLKDEEMVDEDEAESESPVRDGAIFLALVSAIVAPLVLPVMQAAVADVIG